MKVKVSEATPVQLNWLVAKCEGRPELYDFGKIIPWTTKLAPADERGQRFSPTTSWSQGGPIIEREGICTISSWNGGKRITNPYDSWRAHIPFDSEGNLSLTESTCYGATALIAAMRCYVASKLGDEVDIPEELA